MNTLAFIILWLASILYCYAAGREDERKAHGWPKQADEIREYFERLLKDAIKPKK